MLLDRTDGKLLGRIWGLTWPMVIFNALELTVGLVDLAMVRPFGSPATAAIGIGRQVTWLVETLAAAVTVALIALLSQAIGAGSRRQVRHIAGHSWRVVALIGIPASLVGFALSKPLLVAMQVREETIAHGQAYLQIYFAGLLFLLGYLIGTAMFRAIGDSITPLKVGIGVNLINVVLNWIFIYGPGPFPAIGVPGAAMGTVAARACGMLVTIFLWQRRQVRQASPIADGGAPTGDTGGRWFDWPLIGRMLHVGLPMTAAGLLRNGSRLVFLAVVGGLGTSFHAAVGVGLVVRTVGVLPALAFQVATATLLGQAIGRGDVKEAERLAHHSAWLLGVLMVGLSAMIVTFAHPLAGFFIAAEPDRILGATVLRWFAIAQVFSGLAIVAQGALMGAGDTQPAMWYTFLSQWCVLLPLTYALSQIESLSPHGPLAAWTIAPILSAILTVQRFRGGRWKILGIQLVPRDQNSRQISQPPSCEKSADTANE